MKMPRALLVFVLVVVLLVQARTASPIMSIEVVGAGFVDNSIETETFVVYNNRPPQLDLDLNGDFLINSVDLGIYFGKYDTYPTTMLGRILGHFGFAWHRQDLVGAPDFGWYYVVPPSLHPVITHDPDNVTTYLSWGLKQSFRTLRETGNLQEGLHITIESRERRTFYIKMVSR